MTVFAELKNNMMMEARAKSQFVLVLMILVPASASIISVTFDGTLYKTHNGFVKDWVAKCNFTDNTFIDGWAYLEIETNSAYPDTVQAYAAGFSEGVTSRDMIYKAYRNTLEGFCKWKSEEFCNKLREYLKENMLWMKSLISQKRESYPIWHNVELILSQLTGVADGYNKTSEHVIEPDSILWLNLMGDLEDLESALDPSLHNMSIEDWVRSGGTIADGHCSAMIKLLPGNTDLYVSHVTWNSYQSMLRVQKKYILPFRRTGSSKPKDVNPGHTVTFSSYPGMIFSGDDYYILSSGLVTLETTIGNSNPALWKNVTATGELQEWIRTIVANRLAEDGKSWTDFFSMHNSGTYNNQWMVVDYKLFKPRQHVR